MALENQPNIEERVLDFTAQQRAVKRNRVSTASRLNQDLGMDGDDAVEFFRDFSAEFKVNLDDLYSRWGQHFGPEGVSFGFLVIVVLGITAGFWLRDLVGILPAWAWGIGLTSVGIVAHQLWFVRKMVPITVGDLVESARSGRWKKSYNGSC
jgi:acyl carrier protein